MEPMSLISPSPSMWLIPMLTMNTAVACGVAGAPAGVRTFGEERSVYWREAAAGHSRSAYYVGKILSVLYRFVITSLHFSAIYFVLGKSLMNFWDFFSVVLLLFYCIYGLASNVSMLSRPGNATLLGCLTCRKFLSKMDFLIVLINIYSIFRRFFWIWSHIDESSAVAFDLHLGHQSGEMGS